MKTLRLLLPLLPLIVIVLLTSCAKDVKRTGSDGPGMAGSQSEALHDFPLPGRIEGVDLENADYQTLSSYTVFFRFDSFAIDATERPKLEAVARWLNQNPASKIVLAGHTDSRGTIQYNLGLGERRALATRTYLLGLGIDGDRMGTISYGEERPAQTGENESAWAANRRANIGVLR